MPGCLAVFESMYRYQQNNLNKSLRIILVYHAKSQENNRIMGRYDNIQMKDVEWKMVRICATSGP